MICFHSLNYWYLQQLLALFYRAFRCCDLLSFFELLIFTTTPTNCRTDTTVLWFAFILWTTDIYNNVIYHWRDERIVVICFHSLNYWYLQQLEAIATIKESSCDLLSFFELLIFTTTSTWVATAGTGLWFAFILWTTDIYNNEDGTSLTIAGLWFAFILWTTDIYNNLS